MAWKAGEEVGTGGLCLGFEVISPGQYGSLPEGLSGEPPRLVNTEVEIGFDLEILVTGRKFGL